MSAIRRINVASEKISDEHMIWLAYCGMDSGMNLGDFLGLVFGTYGLDSSVEHAIARLMEISEPDDDLAEAGKMMEMK